VRRRSSGLRIAYVDMTDLKAIEAAIGPDTKMIWVETPTNPLLKLVDLGAVAAIAKRHGLLTVADNTFASPWIQRPLEYGFDIVFHSATKVSERPFPTWSAASPWWGITMGSRTSWAFWQNAIGGIQGPFDSFLALRGVKTLALRMQRHSENGLELAGWLERHPKIELVRYPGLPSHAQHDLAKRADGAGYGGMISVVVKGGIGAAKAMLERTQLSRWPRVSAGWRPDRAPGDHDSRNDPAGGTAGAGIADGLVRLSAESKMLEDLRADLEDG